MPLREIEYVRQVNAETKRRWFTSEDMDLFLFIDPQENIQEFQLCLNKGVNEVALCWNMRSGFYGVNVDDGEFGSPSKYKEAPIFRHASEIRAAMPLPQIENALSELPPNCKNFVMNKLIEFSAEVFNTPLDADTPHRTT